MYESYKNHLNNKQVVKVIFNVRPHHHLRWMELQSHLPASANVPPTMAHWRHMANVIKIVLTSVHSSLQPKRQIDRFSHFCTAHGRMLSGIPWNVLSPNNCPFAWGIWAPSNTASLGPAESITQTTP